ncbi:MAG: GAF domain-containing protein [Gemmatimonadaceae bacterium]|nr:GAF domain-containing protein [Gemmatimonadaceae bacterium]
MRRMRRPNERTVLGALTERLVPGDLGRTLDEAADLLLKATGAVDCEIALREPEGEDMLLACCRGVHRRVLQEQLRFRTGDGFPGIVASTGQPVSTRSLQDDARFLRPGLTRFGVTSFLSVPLVSGPGHTLGCVSLAWRSRRAPLQTATTLVQRAGLTLAAFVRAELLAAREKMEQAVFDAGPGTDVRASACLATLIASARARHGSLVLYGAPGRESSLFSCEGTASICADALDGMVRCRQVQSGHGVIVAGAREEWPLACRCLPPGTQSPLCLPLRVDRRLVGVAVLDRPEPPEPASRDLIPLLAMAAEAAVRLDPGPGVAKRKSVPRPRADRMLDIRCLGGLEVHASGTPVPLSRFARRKALTLLRILVLEPGTPMSRDALVERLWPGVDGASGANRLHGVIHALRSVIEPYRHQRKWLFLCNTGDVYYFNAQSPHWIDLQHFRRGVAAGEAAIRQGRRDEAMASLEGALELYRGDLFADDPYADWCEVERTEARKVFVAASARLADLCCAQGAMDRGIACLHRALRVDPLREDLHQRVIRALIRSGRREDALLQYRLCSQLLRDELGTAPQAETRRLERAALSGQDPVSLPILV